MNCKHEHVKLERWVDVYCNVCGDMTSVTDEDVIILNKALVSEVHIELLRLSSELLKIDEPKSIKAFASEIKRIAEKVRPLDSK